MKPVAVLSTRRTAVASERNLRIAKIPPKTLPFCPASLAAKGLQVVALLQKTLPWPIALSTLSSSVLLKAKVMKAREVKVSVPNITNPIIGPPGPAALPGIPSYNRLMFSAVQPSAAPPRLLVKGEWDAAEQWLQGHIDN
jgi:hypothetical protein